MECHERQLMHLPPINALTTPVRGLMLRGFVKVKAYINAKGKITPGVYITKSGLGYLDTL